MHSSRFPFAWTTPKTVLCKIEQSLETILDLFGNPQNCHSGASRNLEKKKASSLDSGFHRNDSFRTSLLENAMSFGYKKFDAPL